MEFQNSWGKVGVSQRGAFLEAKQGGHPVGAYCGELLDLPGVIGKSLGQYEVAALLGAGGMGEVYRARDTKLGREVAIKVLTPELDLLRHLPGTEGSRTPFFSPDGSAL